MGDLRAEAARRLFRWREQHPLPGLRQSHPLAAELLDPFIERLCAALLQWVPEQEEQMNDQIEELLTRWRAKDEALDRGTWHGVSKIAGAVGAPISGTRKALHALADAGKIERGEFDNGTYWRGRAVLQKAGG
jgi:hypothetical protein